MTAPIDTAYEALRLALANGMVEAGFFASAEALQDEPEGAWEPEGEDEGEGAGVVTAGALFPLEAQPVRPLMGGTRRRFVVEAPCRLELACAGPIAAGQDSHRTRLRAALDVLALLANDDPTLGQTCERLEIGGAVYEDLPPSGLKVLVEFTIRLRAGDPLGRTEP